MAQVMKYHMFPTNYNWAAMPNETSSNETARLMKDIGTAVEMKYSLAAGSNASMAKAKSALVNTFGYSSSIQYVDYDLSNVLAEINNSRPVIMEAYHTYYTTTSGWWIFKQTTHHYKEGHAWVCDGYRVIKHLRTRNPGSRYENRTYTTYEYFLHMNWGWGETGMINKANNDGWFKYDDWQIRESLSPKGENFNFQFRKKCVIGIKH